MDDRITVKRALSEMASRDPLSQPPAVRVPAVLERRPAPQVAHKRNRDWEDRQRAQGKIPVSFRGIPVELRDELKEIAEEEGLRVGEIARLFLEYGLTAYTSGELALSSTIEGGRLTLYPGEG